MAKEDLTQWLAARIRLLKAKSASLQKWRFSQRRLLRAFPHLRKIAGKGKAAFPNTGGKYGIHGIR